MSTDPRPLLLEQGRALIDDFCLANDLPIPGVQVWSRAQWRVAPCAYYRRNIIHVCIEKCSRPGTAGRAWSWPGYATDRTPYGVIAHELGHHVDVQLGTDAKAYWSDYSANARRGAAEPPLTSYCPDDAEWLAEMFRLFATNPDLLAWLRPRSYATLRARLRPVVMGDWRAVLVGHGAPERHTEVARRKVESARRVPHLERARDAQPPVLQSVLDV